MKPLPLFIAALTASAALSLLTGCSQAVDHTIAGAIKNALPTAIGPAQSYSVTVASDPIEALQGRLKRVDIVGSNVSLSPQLVIDQLNIDARDIVANPQTRKITSVGQVTFVAEVGQSSIDHYLSLEPDDSSQKKENLRVEINDSSITATIDVRTAGITFPASVTGTFQVESGNPKYIDFVPSSGSLSIIPVPVFALRIALRQINPVIDLTTSTAPVNIDNVSIQSGKLILDGTADLTQGLIQGT